jgi:hypothetical protein
MTFGKARGFNYYDDWKSEVFVCPDCGWKGTFDEGSVELHSELMDMTCPKCDVFDAPMLAIVSYATTRESRENWDKLTDSEKEWVKKLENHHDEFEDKKLRKSTPLPGIKANSFVLRWDYRESDQESETVIRCGEEIIFSEPATYEGYERYIEVAKILKNRYGRALADLEPTDCSELYLYGDSISASEILKKARNQIFR